MEQGAAEKDGDGTQTIVRYESLTEVLTERKTFLISYTAKYSAHLDQSRIPRRLGTIPGAGLVTSLRLRPVSVCMELSVVILTLVDELVEDNTKLYPQSGVDNLLAWLCGCQP